MSTDRTLTADRVREVHDPRIPALVHEGWRTRIPWLVQGTTTRRASDRPFDLGLHSGATPEARVRENWSRLLSATGMLSSVLARQVHEADVTLHRRLRAGVHTMGSCDGHATDEDGVLLTVTVADCVPVFVVSERPRAVAVLHAGWRGTAAGVLERGLSLLADELGASVAELLVHMGPSICGTCYEVGPEVFTALGRRAPESPAPIDLRALLAERAVAAGVPWANVSTSTHCTRCTGSGLFSHRGGDGARQVGYVGIRA